MTAEHPNSGPSSDDGVFSLEDLDKIIEAEDPTFKEQMESIQTTGFDVQGSIESIDVDGSDADAPEPTEDENRELTRAEKIREFFLKISKKFFQHSSFHHKKTQLAIGLASVADWKSRSPPPRREPGTGKHHRSGVGSTGCW